MHSRLLGNFILGLVSAVAIAIAISLFSAATATTRFYYSVTDLGTLNDYPYTFPYRINDLAQAVGWSRIDFATSLPPTSQRAFLWQNPKITNLGTIGGTISRAYGINNKRQIVGFSLTTNGIPHAFVWQNSTIKDLETYGTDNASVAWAINNSNQVVGWSYQDLNPPYVPTRTSIYQINKTSHAVLWQNGDVIDLGTLSGDNFSQAFNINNQGQILGWSFNTSNNIVPGTTHVFRWEKGTMTNLGNLVAPTGYTSSLVYDINNKGQVVGSLQSSSGEFAAFVWQNGTLTNLGNLGGTANGSSISEAFDINEAGAVVGVSSASSGSSPLHAFVWRNGIMRDLNNLLPPNSGWELGVAWGINNKGQIVGAGTFNGQDKAFLLTPVRVTT